MTGDKVDSLFQDLVELLRRLIDYESDLLALLNEKLEAMRRADSDGMLALSMREGELTAKIAKTDGDRHALVGSLCRALDIQCGRNTGAVPLREIAARLDPGRRHVALDCAERLRRRMLEVAEANRVVELVSREMLAHFKNVFSAIVQDDGEAETYSSHGQVKPASGARMIDAMG